MKEKVSVIIPFYNSEKTIVKCLQGLERQHFNEFNVILVDDGSTDKSLELINEFEKKSRLKIKILKIKHRGPAGARNFGAKKSKAGIIVFLDSDCIAPQDFLKKISEDFKKYCVAGVGGTYRTLNRKSIIARYSGYEIEWRHSRQPEFTDFLGSYCCAYKRSIFLGFNGFNESFPQASGEDPELSFRISKAGRRLLFDKSIFVWHRHPSNLIEYLKKQFWRAYWRMKLYAIHPKKISGDSYTGLEIPFAPLFAAVFVLALILSPFYFDAIYLSLIGFSLLFALYYNFFVFISRKEIQLIPLSFVIIFLRNLVWLSGAVFGLKLFFGNKF
ncbi:MAG: glycosyltransferase [Candidatus Diapherotrites archaeon]